MQGEAVVSGGGKLRVLSLACGEVKQEAAISDCGAVCPHAGGVFAASGRDGVIYRLDGRLLPCGVYAGGPGMRALCLSGDGERLCVLLGEADSVLMLNGHDGSPLLLARVGASPCRMRLDDAQGHLIVAGGKDGSASVLCAATLRTFCTLREEGVCCDALRTGGRLCMLMMTPSMDTRLVVHEAQGDRWQIGLCGLPGSMCARGRALLLTAGEWLCSVDPVRRRVCRKTRMPGAAGRVVPAGEGMLLLCPLEETLYLFGGGEPRLLLTGVRDAAAE